MTKYFLICVILLFAACSSPDKIEEVKPIEVRTIEIQKPAPIVPTVDQLQLRSIEWIVLTPENIDQKFNELKTGETVFFAVTASGYENIALNLSDIRAILEQQKKIIAIYKSHYK